MAACAIFDLNPSCADRVLTFIGSHLGHGRRINSVDPGSLPGLLDVYFTVSEEDSKDAEDFLYGLKELSQCRDWDMC